MTAFLKRIRQFFNTTIGFYCLVVFLFWLKTYYCYKTDFTLGVSGGMQEFLLAVNPIPSAMLLFGIALYFRGKLSYWLMLIIDFLQSTWIFANILYYREFSDFLSMGIIQGTGNVQNNLGKSFLEILKPTDFIVYVDIVILILLLLFRVIKISKKPLKLRYAVGITILSLVLMFAEYNVANADRSGLLTRTFDNNYIVKYLGLNEYAAFSAYQTHQESTTRSKAKATDLKSVQKFVKNNYASPNVSYYGKEKGKNVFIIHLESFQQFLIDYKVNGKEVTPNINKFYHDQHTLSFDNFYHQVAQGKTSDAEMMLENSLYGLPQGSAMVTYGGQNTYQAAPSILDQKGYTTAAFHGDVPTFWNRNNTYKSWGYDYFFSEAYYKNKPNYNIGYGMKDKIFFKQSIPYIQQLPQPFYAKLITLTNHYPYEIDKQNTDFPAATTGDSTVDPYVQTAHYLDQAFGEFEAYLQKSGLAKNSVVVLYGDHYGISNNHRPAIAKLLNKKSVNKYDLAQFQKVPFMINGANIQGGIDHTYGGEIDVLPTLLHLLGVNNQNMIQFGQDLTSKDNNQIVPFRNGDFVSPKYTKVGSTVYDTKTGTELRPNGEQKQEIAKMQDYVNGALSNSDKVVYGDLLRFHKIKGYHDVNKKAFNYSKKPALKKLKQTDEKEKTDLVDQNGGKSTVSDFQTDAPELK
ncbi:LTA synthase family protein [Fructilactobacillus myrtifloralis]|uniref:LTA synthase family protein n=1 Tax=Fructilactobacillus myrtifloralis TaxID=2940301 RepID=A0ABY5BPB9_9LACO|nr:LTA synthase family protein [Fructilactobacillus myrtifloralis]USS85544.1 LTA synthase family protein [Fructilactobacillus myrtifloralis]